MKEKFEAIFGTKPSYLFSAPGRTELGGNHTDHQRGRVLAAAVNLETLAAVAENGLNVIRIHSENFPPCSVALSELGPVAAERNTTVALVRGVAARFAAEGAALRGFDAYCTSTVLPGSGLSSSAAFEVLLCTVINTLFFHSRRSPMELAQIGQWAENVYFGKPCGLMDQMVSAVGNVVGIDFADLARPAVEQISFSFAYCGYTLCIIDTGADHADLTDEYGAITAEMRSVSEALGKTVLREVGEAEFYRQLPALRERCGDRAVLRAMHFFDEDKRVVRQIAALREGSMEQFLFYVNQSGRSSWQLLQNVVPRGALRRQDVAFALSLTAKLLNGAGAVRVHGGGFAGTIQAYVPNAALDSFLTRLTAALGDGCCHVVSVCPEGGRLVRAYN